ncbi:MAG: glycosyltransferase [Clostridia bacterium]|nr:glycosyltransferase [Clostridia bacterium]
MPKISIIVPVYKVEQYLDCCVESILAQTFTDFELILVDDGSPDNCPQMCDNWATKDARIKVIHKPNGGLSDARNAGVESATGEYVCFIDSDDLIAPTYCQTLYGMLHGTQYDFSVCGVHRFPDGEIPNVEIGDISPKTVSNIEFLAMQFQKKTEFGVWNKLYRRSLFQTLSFQKGKVHEDVIFSADLSGLNNGVIYTDEKLLYYRQREGSIVATTSQKCSPDRIYAGEYLLNKVKKHCPDLLDYALKYAVDYPFMFVDPIYVNKRFKQNKQFLNAIQSYLKRHIKEYKTQKIFEKTTTHRMSVFAKSRFLYGFNAYARLLRVYFYRLIHKDPYKTGHGI